MAGIDQYTKLLLHMDDGNFTDKMGHVVTNNGVTLDTNVKKFGSGSGKFNGSSSLKLSDNEDWNFGNGDFTIDFWIKTTANNTFTSTVINQSAGSASSNSAFCIGVKGGLIAYLSTGTNWAYTVTSSAKCNDGLFHHCAVVRRETVLYLFVDGVISNTTILNTGWTMGNSSLQLEVGCQSNVNYFNGYIDELRISKGVARWTSDFTPPTLPYGTACLIQDRTNVLKTIQNGNIVDLVETTPTEELFQTQGFDDITLINSVTLEPESKILTWTDNTLATKLELKYEISPFRIMDNPTNYNLKMYTDNTTATSATLNYNCESYRPVDKANPQFDIVMYKE